MKFSHLIIASILFAILAGLLFWTMSESRHLQASSTASVDGEVAEDQVASDGGKFLLTFQPAEGEPGLGPIAVWHLGIRTPDGTPVRNAEIGVSGGMPEHGHGLPTSPAPTGEISPGLYTIDGVRFSMTGRWEFVFEISADGVNDRAVFEVNLSP